MNINSGIWSSGKRAIVVGVFTALALILTSGSIGITRDEPTFIAASESYTEWFTRLVIGPHGVLNQGVIDSAWDINIEQPPFDKEISGWVWALTHNLLDDLLAHRLANILLASLAVALLYQMVSDEAGGIAGIAAAAALLVMPRFFSQAHLAALDVPATSMIVLVTYVFWRTKESARIRYTLWLGIVWGLAVATGIHALLVLPTLLLWMLLFRRKWYLLLRLLVAACAGLVVSILVWPWLYYDTAARVKDFLEGVVRGTIPEYYLGQNLIHLPWHFPWVMVAAVVPLGVLILCLLGILRAIVRRRDRAFGFMLIFSALVPLAAAASGFVNVFDNDRMLMPAFPFLAILAGGGFGWFVKSLGALVVRYGIPRLLTPLLGIAGAGLVFIPPVVSMVSYAPYWLSYYSESVGGLRGAERLGFETTYGYESYSEAVAFINEHAQPGDSVWVLPSSMNILVYYQQHGILRDDISLASLQPVDPIFGSDAQITVSQEDFSQADFVIVPYRQSALYGIDNEPTDILQWISSRQPAFRVEREGTPIMDIYTNP